ncbi:GH35 family endo-1,4-beta-xylanase, partial [Limimaricola variabilis]|nr:GH35 family endo-1,4-beta-xylanase [Limimaricola variabilis]
MALSDFADSIFVQALQEDCGLIVPEYELQWDRMRPTLRRTDWRRADALLELAQRQGLELRGHAMLWHGALPNWFEALSPAAARRAALARISSLGRRYRGRVHSWDVVNEPLSETGEGLRDGPLLRAFGAGLLSACFARAAQADPGTLLVLNEMGLEYGGAQADRKRHTMLRLLERELGRGTPIGALGLQGHLDASDGPHDH